MSLSIQTDSDLPSMKQTGGKLEGDLELHGAE